MCYHGYLGNHLEHMFRSLWHLRIGNALEIVRLGIVEGISNIDDKMQTIHTKNANNLFALTDTLRKRRPVKQNKLSFELIYVILEMDITWRLHIYINKKNREIIFLITSPTARWGY